MPRRQIRRGRKQRPRSTRLPDESRWIGFSRAVLIAQYVPDSADGLDQLGAAWEIDLVSKHTHENVECIVFDVPLMAPGGLHHPGARYNPSRISHQEFKQSELDSSKRDDGTRALHFARCRIHPEIGGLKVCLWFHGLAS